MWPALPRFVWIEKGRRFEIRAGVPFDGDRFREVGAEAAFVPYAADEFDEADPFVERDIGAADEGLEVEVGGCSADAVLVHSFTVASKLPVRNPNLHDMA